MLIQVRAPRLKPLGGPVLRVRRDHALAVDLRACFIFGGTAGVGLDLVTGVPLDAVNAPGLSGGIDGPALDLSGTAYASAPKHPDWNITGAVSIGWRGILRSLSGFQSIVHNVPSGGNSAANSPFSFAVNSSAGDGKPQLVRSNSGYFDPFKIYNGPAGAVSANVPTSLSVSAGTTIDTAPTFGVNGVVTAGVFFYGSGVGAAGTNSDPLFVGRRQDGAMQQDGLTSLLLLAAIEWDTTQHLAFDAAPYGILEDAPLYFFLADGPTTTTVSLTGIALTSSAGSVEEGIAVAAAGSAATSAAGTPTSAIASALAGSAGTASAGTATSGIGMSLTGEALTVSAGSLAYTIGFTLTGSAATSAGGTLTSSGADVLTSRSLTGISMTALPGNVRVTGGTRWRPSEAQAVTPPSMVGNTLQPPPRLVGDPASDNRAIQQWLQTLYDHVIKRDNVLGRIADHETRIAAIEATDDTGST